MTNRLEKKPVQEKLILCDRCGAPAKVDKTLAKIICTNPDCAFETKGRSRWRYPVSARMQKPL